MPTRIYYVPIVLAIEADHPDIAATEAVQIAEGIAVDGRHLRKDVIVPRITDARPDHFTHPRERFLHRGIVY